MPSPSLIVPQTPLLVGPNQSLSSTSSTISSNSIWIRWNALTTNRDTITTTYSSSPTNSLIWTNWNNAITSAGTQGRIHYVPTREPTPAEIQAAGEQTKARERAQKLLNSCLSNQQRDQLKDKGYFELDVFSPEGEPRRYRIERKWSGSVHRVNRSTGKIEKTLCIHPRITTPVEDSMLAQKLMLESGMEEQLLQIANHWN